jgi:hypothetical protein
MAVREFTDGDGRRWRAWEVRPEAIHPQTRSEDYLADCYVTGWIVFETILGDEKRRLCPWPIRWKQATEEGLRDLLNQAEAVPPQKLKAERKTVGESLPTYDDDMESEELQDVDVTDLQVIRTFRYPGGRFWTVYVVSPPESGRFPVLRFTSGTRSIDLHSWSRDWADEPDDRLASMLRLGAPRRQHTAGGPNTPKRRWTDQPDAQGD